MAYSIDCIDAVKDRATFLEKPNHCIDPFCLTAGAEQGAGKGLSGKCILTFIGLNTALHR